MNHYFPGVGLVSIIMDSQITSSNTTYPSPEPAPAPQEVVSAQEVIKYRMNFMEDNDIHIKIKDNLSNTSYSEAYSKDGDFGQKTVNIFKIVILNDFMKF